MDKQAGSSSGNSRFAIPFLGDVNNRRFVTAVLAGVLGGAGVSAAANLLRSYREMRKPDSDDTDDETIVLTLPKSAADGYTGMRDAKPGETKITANGGRQFRESGRYASTVARKEPESQKEIVKKSDDGNPGPNSVGTIVANAIGLTAGGLLSYEVASRMFDAMQERKLKRKLKAAQQAYVNAMAGASKRAEAVMSVIRPAERALSKGGLGKSAGFLDMFPDGAADTIRYPAAAYVLALLAGTGATAYVTKKVLDREFPEEKLKKDVNWPTRIVFRTEGGKPSLVEGPKGKEKKASAETCAAITAMLPIYMDVVEGRPSRTLAAPYVKLAAAAGTDPAGLMKMAAENMGGVYKTVLSDPKAVWAIMKGTKFGLNFSKMNAVNALREARPETYRRAVDAAIDAHFAGGPNDGFVRRSLNSIGRVGAKAFTRLGGRDFLVNQALKSASVDDMLSTDGILKAIADEEDQAPERAKDVDDATVMSAARKRLGSRRRLLIEAGDPAAAKYIKANKGKIGRVLARLNAKGVL